MFAAPAFIFIVLWLALTYGDDTYVSRRRKMIGYISAVLGISLLAIQILQWAKVI
jgi:hypothetical protein